MSVEWSELPPELLETISGKLTIYVDYIRFRAVCISWRSATRKTPTHLPCQLPWLMLPQSSRSPLHPRRRAFFSLSDNKLHLLNLPEASRRRHCGSSYGWLVILDESPSIFLLNPLTRSKIHLPPLSSFPNVNGFNFYDVGRECSLRTPFGDVYTCSLKEMRDSFLKKVILSSPPSKNSNFVAMAILDQTGDLAYYKNGEDRNANENETGWKFIEEARLYSEDVIYYNGLFYAVNKFGAIAVCDVGGGLPRVSFIDTPRLIGGDMQYLLHFMGELLLVTRYLELEYDADHPQVDIMYKTIEFRVFKLDMSGPKWETLTNLGNRVLFLGENSSLALSASDFPGCKGNCIYFTDDYSESNYDGLSSDHDLGVYNLEDGSIEALPCYSRNPHSQSRWPPPIWVTPNPC